MKEELEKEPEKLPEKDEEKTEADLKSRLSQLRAEVDGLTGKWKRAVADYQNLEKRVARERDDLTRFSNLILLKKLLGVLDNLERAKIHLNDPGFDLIIKDFKNILTEQGLAEIEVAAGDGFDPFFEECVELIEGDEDQKVVEVVAKGYIIGDRVLRPAKVKVSKKGVKPSSSGAESEAAPGDFA